MPSRFQILIASAIALALVSLSCNPTQQQGEPDLTPEQIQTDLLRFVRSSYPEMEITVAPWDEDPSRLAVTFVEAKFSLLLPMQRYHYLAHLIPSDYQEAHLKETVWFELAPGERPEDLVYPDEALIEAITPDVMKVVSAARALDALDDALCPEDKTQERAACYGDFRNVREILLQRGFTEQELPDVFHVFMAQGGYCDCEILYNVASNSRLSAEYWQARADGRPPYDPHNAK